MNKTLIWVISILVLTAGGVAVLYGQRSPSSPITLKQPQPEVLVVNTPTAVTIPAIITGDVLPGGANLLSFGANGQSTILGQLTPNASLGANGYSITRSFTETVLGTITLQLSVAIRGQLRRVTSEPFLLAVSTKAIVLPPDPGEAGKATLAGIDSDNDGVRDDIQRYIVFHYPGSEKTRAALSQVTNANQDLLFSASNPSAAAAIVLEANHCLYSIVGGVMKGRPLRHTLEAEILNTKQRSQAFIAANNNLGGQVVGSPGSNLVRFCKFDPTAMGN